MCTCHARASYTCATVTHAIKESYTCAPVTHPLTSAPASRQAGHAHSWRAVCAPVQVLPCVHANLEDYTTDNRGDVGSWVRESAMGVLEVSRHVFCCMCGANL